MAPICSHESYGLLHQVIPYIVESFTSNSKEAILLNIATDGDTARRKSLNSMKRPNNSLGVLKLMKYFDTNLVCGNYSVNFDPKHLAKRIRSIIISSSRSMVLNKIQINSSIINEFLKSRNIAHVNSLMDPHDKQNVPMAVSLLNIIHEQTIGDPPIDPLSRDIFNEIKLLGIITSLFLSLFTKLDINLIDQLLNMSHLSHLLLYIFRRHKSKFITKNLYCDLQSTIQDAFVVAAKFIEINSKADLLLYQLGTDQLEILFGTIRTLTHSSNCDFLELIERCKMAFQIESVYIKEPNLRKASRLSSNTKTADDHSSSNEWCGQLTTENLRLVTVWNFGQKKAEATLKKFDFDCSHDLSNSGITMMNPFGSQLDEENSIDDEDFSFPFIDQNYEDINLENLQDLMPPFSSSTQNSMYVQIDGAYVHKSNAVNSILNNKTKTSKDRLIRVQSKAVSVPSDDIDEIDDSDTFLKVNDTVLSK